MSDEDNTHKPAKWSFGVLNPESTDEVPGSVLLLPKSYEHNEPLGLHHVTSRTSASNFPLEQPRVPFSSHGDRSRPPVHDDEQVRSRSNSVQTRAQEDIQGSMKTTQDGIILEPQPEDSKNDPLNWKQWRRDLALICLGFFCFIGGGMTPVLAAGFSNVAQTYDINISEVSLTTGCFMLGLGIGGVFVSPTAIIYGKRPLYIIGATLFVISAVWCALSPNFPSLVVARIFQGIALSPCEALPSATIAEIYFLHERAYRLGIYTLLLLGGKNLMPLISSAIINELSWQWVFWILAIFGAFSGSLLFLFVPETFWDRVPQPGSRLNHHKFSASMKSVVDQVLLCGSKQASEDEKKNTNLTDSGSVEKHENVMVPQIEITDTASMEKRTIAERRRLRTIEFAPEPEKAEQSNGDPMAKIYIDHTDSPRDNQPRSAIGEIYGARTPKTANFLHQIPEFSNGDENEENGRIQTERRPLQHRDSWRVQPHGQAPKTPNLPNFNSPSYTQAEFNSGNKALAPNEQNHLNTDLEMSCVSSTHSSTDVDSNEQKVNTYTEERRNSAPMSFVSNLRPWNGRLRQDNWAKAAFRPFVLYAYPSVLWSALVYSLSVGWLIVLSESVTVIYRMSSTYNFTAFQCGLVYLSPFIGGVLGTAVAGKLSDLIVRWMARRNGGVYEPEFRLVMAVPILISTVIGLMGFGWAAQERDAWIVPTVFFGIISFGCSLGSTTAITFVVDSYRQYAAEALVTLNFSKNVLHGFVFSFFFTGWLEVAGSKTVFLIIGGIQVVCLLFTIPMFIYGKRARLMTARWGLADKW